jgi:hypothetical protein
MAGDAFIDLDESEPDARPGSRARWAAVAAGIALLVAVIVVRDHPSADHRPPPVVPLRLDQAPVDPAVYLSFGIGYGSDSGVAPGGRSVVGYFWTDAHNIGDAQMRVSQAVASPNVPGLRITGVGLAPLVGPDGPAFHTDWPTARPVPSGQGVRIFVSFVWTCVSDSPVVTIAAIVSKGPDDGGLTYSVAFDRAVTASAALPPCKTVAIATSPA